MKFNKLYILPLLAAALGLGACSDSNDGLFDLSAAERLEAGKKDYFNTLCSEGGLWAMEYFANDEEPGYIFVMEFHNDKSVVISTDHKWINNVYKSERSLFDVINDDGNVLTFNSYNNIFHIFSTPENFTGPDAPKDTNGQDVDEQGYGHNGDYEFMLMEKDNDNIRLRGKKRGYNSFLRRLPAGTDPQAYLAEVAAKRQLFSYKKFPTYTMTETATGAQYDVTGLSSGVATVMPHNTTSQFSRTEEKAFIVTQSGLRPIEPFDFIRENDSHFTVNEFTWANDGSLVAPGVRLTAPIPAFSLSDRTITWKVDISTISPELQKMMDQVNSQLKGLLGASATISDVEIGYNADYGDGKIRFGVTCTIASEVPCNYYGSFEAVQGSENVKFAFNLLDFSSETVMQSAPKLKDFMELFAGEYEAKNISPMDPTTIVMKNLTQPAVYFNLKI